MAIHTSDNIKKLGKVSKDLFEKIIYKKTGAKRSNVVVPPKHGVDFGVVEHGEYAVIVKSDPVFVVPEYGWERSGWFAVHILASDVSTSGNAPQYLAIDLNLPVSMSDEEFEKLWNSIHEECLKLGISIVAGHTGRYEGANYPMLGGATMFSIVPKDHYVTTEMARVGDAVIMTKGPAIETAGILSVMFPEVLREKLGDKEAEKAESIFYMQTVVPEALTLAELGLRDNVTSMHDATEYGVWGALYDIALASGVGIRVFEEDLFIDPLVETVVRVFEEVSGIRINVFEAISEGTLIATVSKSVADEAIDILNKKGIRAQVIGEVTDKSGIVELVGKHGETNVINRPTRDPFWDVFFRMIKLKEQLSSSVQKRRRDEADANSGG